MCVVSGGDEADRRSLSLFAFSQVRYGDVVVLLHAHSNREVCLLPDLVVTAPPSEAGKGPPALEFVFPSRGSRYAPGGAAASQRFTLTARALEMLGGRVGHVEGQLTVARTAIQGRIELAHGEVAIAAKDDDVEGF